MHHSLGDDNVPVMHRRALLLFLDTFLPEEADRCTWEWGYQDGISRDIYGNQPLLLSARPLLSSK